MVALISKDVVPVVAGVGVDVDVVRRNLADIGAVVVEHNLLVGTLARDVGHRAGVDDEFVFITLVEVAPFGGIDKQLIGGGSGGAGEHVDVADEYILAVLDAVEAAGVGVAQGDVCVKCQGDGACGHVETRHAAAVGRRCGGHLDGAGTAAGVGHLYLGRLHVVVV